jgi:flavin reductase (DIM6/NTAB) family NADH-FMN oxidoreductase RutF
MKLKFTDQDLVAMERRYRGNFLNSLGGFKSAVLVGTADFQGQCNLAIFNSLFHVGADPALWGMVVRPCVPGRNTLGNILSTEVFTLNHITPSMMERAHQCSAKYPEGVSEFDQVGFEPEFLEGCNAPFVRESVIKIGCQLVQTTDIPFNGTTLVLGKITHIEIPSDVLMEDGFVNLMNGGSLASSGLDGYGTLSEIKRLSYAKVSTPPQLIFQQNKDQKDS